MAFDTENPNHRDTIISIKPESTKPRSNRYEVTDEEDVNEIDLTARETLEGIIIPQKEEAKVEIKEEEKVEYPISEETTE